MATTGHLCPGRHGGTDDLVGLQRRSLRQPLRRRLSARPGTGIWQLHPGRTVGAAVQPGRVSLSLLTVYRAGLCRTLAVLQARSHARCNSGSFFGTASRSVSGLRPRRSRDAVSPPCRATKRRERCSRARAPASRAARSSAATTRAHVAAAGATSSAMATSARPLHHGRLQPLRRPQASLRLQHRARRRSS